MRNRHTLPYRAGWRSASGLPKRRWGIEPLEPRTLLSAAAIVHAPMATIGVKWTGHVIAAPTSAKTLKTSTKTTSAKAAAQILPLAAATPPFSPAILRHFYGVDSVSFNGTAGTGAGQTIAIIDADNQPNIKTDLTNFDTTFGLAAPPSFTVENETGGSTLPTAYDSGDAIETSLDVEWAHAMAPGANLLLIECNSLSFSDLVQNGVNTANNTAGVSVVTMSFGATDFSGESIYDSYFTHTGITYIASTGDNGSAATGYPATSPNVLAVGGTEITTSDSSGSYGSETVWNDPPPQTSSNVPGSTGGGISSYENKPSYQSAVTQSSTKRTVPDVSFEASVNSGVYVLDSSQSGGGGYYEVGGTSLSAPCWAGLIAQTNQGRVHAGLTSLTGSTQTLPRIYQLPSTDFHDITTGNNNYNGSGGYSAGVGYDLASGRGTPIANKLIPDLAGDASITGRVFQDNNANGIFDGTDVALTGQTVYLDTNNNGVRDTTGVSAEPSAVVSGTGTYTFSSLVNGGDLIGGLTGTVRLLTTAPTGDIAVGTGATFTTAYATASTANVGLFPTVYSDSTGGDAYVVQISPTLSTQLQILLNGSVAYTAPASLASSLSFTFTGTADTLAVDFGNGNPLPAGGLNVNGTSAANNDTLGVLGTSGNDTIAFNASNISVGTSLITFSNIRNLSVDPRGGTDVLTVNAGTVNIPAQTPGGGFLSRLFSTLAIASGAKVVLGSPTARTDRTVLVATTATALSINTNGKLDLGSNDLIVRSGSLSAVNSLVTTGYAGGAWTGNGITSSAAAVNAQHVTALGVSLDGVGGGLLLSTFDGVSVATADILVKYTYYGDANLDGTVDGSDYSKIDGAYGHGLTGWVNGDFNYDTFVDGSDYTLIDNAFNTQGSAL